MLRYCPSRRTITIIKGEYYEEVEEETTWDKLEREEELGPICDEWLIVTDHGEPLVISRNIHTMSAQEALAEEKHFSYLLHLYWKLLWCYYR